MNEQHTINGITKTFLEWCKEYNRKPLTVRSRMSMGHSLEEAMQMHDTHIDRLVSIDGEVHTFQHRCRIYKISECTVRSRLRRGWILQATLSVPPQKWPGKDTTKYYEVDGQMKSIVELSVEHNINQKALRSRLNAGWTIKEALNPIPVGRGFHEHEKLKSSKFKLYTYEGETKTLLGWCDHLGLSLEMVYSRMSNGASFEEAIDKSKFPGVKTYVVYGKEMTLSQIAKECGIDKQYLYIMLTRHNLSIEEAIKRKVHTRKKLYFVIDGRKMSLSQIGEMCNIKPKTLYNRLRNGLTIEEAIEYVTPSKKGVVSHATRTFLINGEQLTVREINKKYNIPISTINGRLRRGLSIEEAIRKQNEPIP